MPSNGKLTRRPLPSTGSSRGEFPCFAGTMGRSDFPPPVSPDLTTPDDTKLSQPVFVTPAEPAARLGGQGSLGSATPDRNSEGGEGPLKFLDSPMMPMP